MPFTWIGGGPAGKPVHREGADSWRPKIGLSYSIFCKKKVKKANSLRSCEFAFVRLEHKSKLSTFLRICFCIIHHGQMAYLFLRQLAHCRRKRLEKTWKMWKNAIFLMRIDADSSSFVNQTKPFFLRQFRLTTQNLLPSAIPHKRRDKNALPSIKINKKQSKSNKKQSKSIKNQLKIYWNQLESIKNQLKSIKSNQKQ